MHYFSNFWVVFVLFFVLVVSGCFPKEIRQETESKIEKVSKSVER
jgi:hypothetical protein